MRAVVQRVSRGEVRVDGAVTGRIDAGLVVYLGVGADDRDVDIVYIVEKVAGLRVFEDSAGKMNLDVAAVGGALLVVPQFTLYGDVRKGRRPAFDRAMAPAEAAAMYEAAVAAWRARGLTVATGVFRATMEVDAVNHGPITILLDSHRLF
ncbi:MAG: D-tyrosyl-tRNA(Tyr) deacylase [Myxococcales bacterium]|nr:D-tyrosyl-tRNA(Tyr) deacylase [Myxococcales bacterium]